MQLCLDIHVLRLLYIGYTTDRRLALCLSPSPFLSHLDTSLLSCSARARSLLQSLLAFSLSTLPCKGKGLSGLYRPTVSRSILLIPLPLPPLLSSPHCLRPLGRSWVEVLSFSILLNWLTTNALFCLCCIRGVVVQFQPLQQLHECTRINRNARSYTITRSYAHIRTHRNRERKGQKRT